jgi:protein-S-isoprenylcysteine O-methyltransferase Ste14
MRGGAPTAAAAGAAREPAAGRDDALRMAGAALAFGVVHSVLASDAAKRLAARLLGERARDGWYRVFFNAQAVATSAALLAYGLRHPGRTLWHVRGPLAALMRVGQAAGIALGAAAVRQVGLLRFVGVPSLVAWSAGLQHVPRGPEAQGPALDSDGRVRDPGPFAWTRHPLNVAPLPVLWLQPRMTTTLAAFSAVATAYLIAGSRHEEARLAARHGAAYETYRRSGVPFFVPHTPPARLPS